MDPKEINRTSFCNKSIDNIVSNDMKKYIIDDMKLRTSLTPSSRYAKIFNVEYSKNLNNPHIFCLKTYGSPYLLYCTKINNVNYTLLIDKRTKPGHNYPKMFIVQYRFHDDLFHGSIAPSAKLNFGLGTTISGSKYDLFPKPLQSGQAPNGLLNENSLGSISSIVNPETGQANFVEKMSIFFELKLST